MVPYGAPQLKIMLCLIDMDGFIYLLDEMVIDGIRVI